MTAYALGQREPRGRSYREIIDWNAARGIDLLRIDAPRGAAATSSGFDRLKNLVDYAHAKGMTVAIGTGILSDLSSLSRSRFVAAMAENFCDDRNVFFERDWEAACYDGPNLGAFNAATTELARAFASRGCAQPRIAVHLMRNNNYAGTSSGYHETNSCKADFTDAPGVNTRSLHEAGKLEGYGVREPGPAHPFVMEALYEDTSGGLKANRLDASLFASEGLTADLIDHADYYYRWYTASTFLSGGAGMVYGMSGVSRLGGNRWDWGVPDGGPYEGLAAMVDVRDFLDARGFDPLSATPNDRLVDNGHADDIQRAKAATMGQVTYVYNPRRLSLEISNQAGKVADLFDPASGKFYPAFAAIDSNQFTLAPPRQISSHDYFLVIHPENSAAAPSPAVELRLTGQPGRGSYSVEAVTTGGDVRQVEFSIDGEPFHTEYVPGYCLFGGNESCSTGVFGRGRHTIAVRATGPSGTAEDTLTVNE